VPPPYTAGIAAALTAETHWRTLLHDELMPREQGQLLSQLCTGTMNCQGESEPRPEGSSSPAVLAHGSGEMYPHPSFSHLHVAVGQVAAAEEAPAP